MGNGASFIIAISQLQFVNWLQGICKHTKLCGQKVYSPCFIDFTIQTEFRVAGDQYQGQWGHVTPEMIRTKCLHSHALDV